MRGIVETTRGRACLVLVGCLVWAVAFTSAQTTDQAARQGPAISEIDNLKLTSALQQYEIWELREQQARDNKLRAVEQVNALLKALQRDGYTFDVQTRTYTPKKDGGM